MRSRAAGPLAAALVALGVLGVAWAGLYRGVGAGHLALLCAVAALPAVASLAPRARAGAVALALALAALLVPALALRISPWRLPSLDEDAWASLRALLPDGLASGSRTSLPISPAEAPELVALLDTALALLAGAAAWQLLARRRPVAGVVLVGVGLAYRWTVEPPASGTAAGAVALAALTAVLALAAADGARAGSALARAGGVLALGGVSVAVAAGLGAGPAGAGPGWWEWRDWEVGPPAASAGTGLDLRQSYGRLRWPETPRVAMTVEADAPRPLRAVSLDEFTGYAFALANPASSRPLAVRNGMIRVNEPVDLEQDGYEMQRVTLVGATTQVLLTSGRPQWISGPFTGTADTIGDAVRVGSAIGSGDRYTVRTRVDRPEASELVAAPPYEPGATPPRATMLRGAPWHDDVEVPLWGTGGPPVPEGALGPYDRVRDLALEVVGDAATPYAAVNRIEAHLRRGYIYDERPPAPRSLPDDAPGGALRDPPPLVDFLMGSRRGYCQHFAGAMGVMLRSVGIPARVAVGYTGGRYDPDEERYVVLDRDAHAWVEVWFPGRGWLPFDPTPGRAAANPASVSSPDYAPSPIAIDLGGIADRAVEPPSVDDADEVAGPGAPADAADAPEPAPPAPAAEDEGGVSAWAWAAAAAIVLAVALGAGRAIRRGRARRWGDERARVIAAARDLEAALARLGWAPPVAAATSERAAAVRAATGVDASGLYRRASLARFGAEPPPPGAGAAAWREAARLRRAARRRAPVRARLRAALGLPPGRRATVDP